MRTLSIDIETYCHVNLKKVGVYRYAADKTFEIMLFAFAFDGGPVQIIDFTAGEILPPEVLKALFNPDFIKQAFNAQFERVCISSYFSIDLDPSQWQCTAVQALFLGLPHTLQGVGEILDLDKQKLTEGKNLIAYFCVPCKPTKTNKGILRNTLHTAPEKWENFKRYCVRDVETEMEIKSKLLQHPVPVQELKYYWLDQKINATGIQVNKNLVNMAIAVNEDRTNNIMQALKALTGLENPNSLAQIKGWLAAEGCPIEALTKDTVIHTEDPKIQRVLALRKKLARTSIAKYEAILLSLLHDNKLKGMFRFYGARTGRWSGQLVQLHNLPRPKTDIPTARAALQYGMLHVLYAETLNILPDLIRSMFIPGPNKVLIVCDFSAIEARVIAWLAGESWRNEVFATHGKIYEASASKMFGIPIDDITKEVRQKGKVAELALGYGGAKGALIAMGALDMGLQEEELPVLVEQWRRSNTKITDFWWAVEKAVKKVISNKSVEIVGDLVFSYVRGILFIQLPGGRKLAYVKPRVESRGLSFEGVDSVTKKWVRIETYGPKLVENIVQAVSRDLLAEALLRLDTAGYKIVGHVHDEVIIEGVAGDYEAVHKCMIEVPAWAGDLIIKADGEELKYYKK